MKPDCTLDGCTRTQYCKQMCDVHYRSQAEKRRRANRQPGPCSIVGCEAPQKTRGLCNGHYLRWWKTGEVGGPELQTRLAVGPCGAHGCARKLYAKGWCRAHYRRVKDRGGPGPVEVRRRNPQGQAKHWKGGYVCVSDPREPGRVVPEHRLAMEVHLDRRLLPWENVHHINGNREHNTIDNLELWCTPQPAGQRVEDLVAWVASAYPEEVRHLLEAR